MKVKYQNLIALLEEKPSMLELSEKLFQLGHEHEIIDDIFHMEFTPNRGDCLSLKGLARDLSIFFGKINEKKIYTGELEELQIEFDNLSPIDCPKISFLEIEIDGNVSKYKPYLENYFIDYGVSKNNFFTDISNYISYELGQPTHCYDRKKINKKISFINKECNQAFKTVHGNEIILSGKNCLFFLDEEVINIAGIMGGESTSCSRETKKALVECAFFNPESIIGRSVKYDLNSDAAHKFERGVDILSQENTLRRFIKIVSQHAHISSMKLKSFDAIPYQARYLEINNDRINQILGTNLQLENYLEILERLGFAINSNIEIPSFRNDISTQNDLAEEVARAIGYNNINSEPFNFNIVDEKKDSKTASMKTFLVNNQFNEVINFPFCNKNFPDSISIDNPLDANKRFMRTSLQDSLIDNLLYNERRQNDSIKLFEIADIYTKNNEIQQKKRIGIIASGRQGHNYKDFSKKIDKKYIDNIFNSDPFNLNFTIKEISRSGLDTKNKDKIFYIECNFSSIPLSFQAIQPNKNESINFIRYKKISPMPSSSRDISFSIDDPSMLQKVEQIVSSFKSSNLKKLFNFDFFINKKTGVIKIGYRFIFQSQTKSLSDYEIDNEMHALLREVVQIDGVTIPGFEF